mgnify:CR=1 FL=1
MNEGEIVEIANSDEIYRNPRRPYTKAAPRIHSQGLAPGSRARPRIASAADLRSPAPIKTPPARPARGRRRERSASPAARQPRRATGRTSIADAPVEDAPILKSPALALARAIRARALSMALAQPRRRYSGRTNRSSSQRPGRAQEGREIVEKKRKGGGVAVTPRQQHLRPRRRAEERGFDVGLAGNGKVGELLVLGQCADHRVDSGDIPARGRGR